MKESIHCVLVLVLKKMEKSIISDIFQKEYIHLSHHSQASDKHNHLCFLKMIFLYSNKLHMIYEKSLLEKIYIGIKHIFRICVERISGIYHVKGRSLIKFLLAFPICLQSSKVIICWDIKPDWRLEKVTDMSYRIFSFFAFTFLWSTPRVSLQRCIWMFLRI